LKRFVVHTKGNTKTGGNIEGERGGEEECKKEKKKKKKKRHNRTSKNIGKPNKRGKWNEQRNKRGAPVCPPFSGLDNEAPR